MLLGADKITVLKNLYKDIQESGGASEEDLQALSDAIDGLESSISTLEQELSKYEGLDTSVNALEQRLFGYEELGDTVNTLEQGMAALEGLDTVVSTLQQEMSTLEGLKGYKVGEDSGDIPTVKDVENMIEEAIGAISGGE